MPLILIEKTDEEYALINTDQIIQATMVHGKAVLQLRDGVSVVTDHGGLHELLRELDSAMVAAEDRARPMPL